MQNNMEPNKILNILILGGGPIGLFAGYKLLKRGHRITVFEKRKEHTRHNILSLGQTMDEKTMTLDTFNLVPSEIMQELDNVSSFAHINECVNCTIDEQDKMIDKPYLIPSSKTYLIVLNELEIVYEKHFKQRGGILLKPETSNAFTDISVSDNIIFFNENSQIRQINMNNFDIILINDGARSYYRDIYFKETSYTENIVHNIHYYGLTADNKIGIGNTPEVVNPLAIGLILIYDIHDKKFLEKFKVVEKIKKKCKFKHLYQLMNENNMTMDELSLDEVETENDEEDDNVENLKWFDSQNLCRMFVSEKYLYISMMLNPKDAKDYEIIQKKSSKIEYDDLSDEIQTYIMFALYYYDLTELIDPRSIENHFMLFPLYFSSVNQSCTFIKKQKENENYILMLLSGDAMSAGCFHSGIVLNKNIMVVNEICHKIDEYIDSHPKVSEQNLDKEFLRLLFFNCNLLNQGAKHEIISKSINCLINYEMIDKNPTSIGLNEILNQYNDIIICKNCPDKNVIMCNNSVSFIKYISENSNKDVLKRIFKYLLLSGSNEYKYEGIVNVSNLSNHSTF